MPPPNPIPVYHHLQALVEKTSTDVQYNVSTAPVVHYIRINTLMVLPTEAKLKKENGVRTLRQLMRIKKASNKCTSFYASPFTHHASQEITTESNSPWYALL
jgi:hypothetical protein